MMPRNNPTWKIYTSDGREFLTVARDKDEAKREVMRSTCGRAEISVAYRMPERY